MVEIIAGKKGKGKTKYLLDKVNAAVEGASGNIVYLDKSQKHMHELSNKVRLINVADYPISNCDEFLGFISGIISRDFDITNIFVDGIFKIVGSDLSVVSFHRIMIYRRCILTVSLQLQTLLMIRSYMQLRSLMLSVKSST